jgi:hypothetical protein
MNQIRRQVSDFLEGTAPSELLPWVRGIEDLGGWATVALELATARVLHPFWVRYPLGGLPGEALASAEAAFKCPCSTHASAAYAASRRAEATADRPLLSHGYNGAAQPPPLWRNSAAALAVAAARVAGDAAWSASKCSEPGEGTSRFQGLAAKIPRSLPTGSHARVRDYLRAALLPWALGKTDEIPEADGVEELRRELAAAAEAEAAIAVDPAIVAAEAEASRRGELRARKIAAYTALLTVDPLRCEPGQVMLAAFFGPSFHESCIVEVLLPRHGTGMLRVLGFDDGLSDFLLDSLFSEEPLSPPSIAWSVRQTMPSAVVERALGRLDGIDAWTIGDDDPDGRDGMSCFGQVVAAGRAPNRFIAWSPWYVGARQQARFFDVLLDLAFEAVMDANARRVLEGVGRHRRS